MTVECFLLSSGRREISCDLAGCSPIYVYVDPARKYVLYSDSLSELLADARRGELTVDPSSLSFLLQAGVVPPPRTIYKELHVLNVGCAAILNGGSRIEVQFSKSFPFGRVEGLNDFRESTFLELVSGAVLSRLRKSSAFLFHSAGKDSNSIALAMAEAGRQDQLTLITHQSSGESDESDISRSIAQKLGFRHITLQEAVVQPRALQREVERWSEEVPLPVLDTVTLAYPLYGLQLPELFNSDLVDGGGNDSYMGTPASLREDVLLSVSPALGGFRFLAERFVASENAFTPATKQRAQWCGFSGFHYQDASGIYPSCARISGFFRELSASRRGLSNTQLKTDIYSSTVIAEMHIRKFRNAAIFYGANPVLPLADEAVASFCMRLRPSQLKDRRRNKVVLRDMLKRRIGLDSDLLGKKGFTFDFWRFVCLLDRIIDEEILTCQYWDPAAVQRTTARLRHAATAGTGGTAKRARELLHRLFLLSAWLNRNKFVAR